MVKKQETVGIAIKSALGQDIPLSLQKRKGFVSLFMNEQRRKLFHYLCNYPGSNMRMVSRDMGVGLPSARWHLDSLYDMGFIERKSIGKFKVFYPCRFIDGNHIPVYALMNKEQARMIFRHILQGGGISHQELSRETGLSPQNLGGWIKKFEAVELVTTVQDGRINRYYPTILVSELEDMERDYRTPFKKFILNKLHQDGVNPKVAESSGTRYVLEIKVGSDNYFLKLYLNPMKTILDGRAPFFREFPKKEKSGAAGGEGSENGKGGGKKGGKPRKKSRKKKLAKKDLAQQTFGKTLKEKLSEDRPGGEESG
jgi:predicted transcriptional regulator